MSAIDLEHQWNDLQDEIRHREEMLKDIVDDANKKIWNLREKAQKVHQQYIDALESES